MKRKYLFIGCICCLFFIYGAQSQTIENVAFEFDGESISITYDLNHNNAEQKFTISLFSSHNNYQKPITLLTGEVGDNILPGIQKKVIWDVRNELPPYFDDELSIKVKALLIELPISQTIIKEKTTLELKEEIGYRIKPFQNTAYKKGSKLKLNWEGGATSDRIKIDLLKNNVFQQTLSQTKNTNAYMWKIPKCQSQ